MKLENFICICKFSTIYDMVISEKITIVMIIVFMYNYQNSEQMFFKKGM